MRDEATRVIDPPLLALMAAEILDWQNTGYLKQDGWLVEYAKQFELHGAMAVRMAEDAVKRSALKYVVDRVDRGSPT